MIRKMSFCQQKAPKKKNMKEEEKKESVHACVRREDEWIIR